MLQKWLSILAAFPILSFSAVTYAATVENVGTGEGSTNHASAIIENTTRVENTNEATANNDINVYLSTGGNSIGEDGKEAPERGLSKSECGQNHPCSDDNNGSGTGNGYIDTGDAKVDIDLTNDVNKNETVICEGGACPKEEDEDVVPDGMGGGSEVIVTPTADESTGGRGGGAGEEATVLPAAGTNTLWTAVAMTLATLAMLYLVRMRKSTLNN